jgi:hypothetical protein
MHNINNIELVAIRGPEATFDWAGMAQVDFNGMHIEGISELSCDVNGMLFNIHRRAQGQQSIPLILREYDPGAIISDQLLARAKPIGSPLWQALNMIETGSTASRDNVTHHFSVSELIISGAPSGGDSTYTRYVFQGGELPYVTHGSEFSNSIIAFDRIETTFKGRRLILRNLNSDREPSKSALAAIVDSPPLNDLEEHALWLGMCYLNGARVKPLYHDNFSASGDLIARIHRRGRDFGHNRQPPIRQTQSAANLAAIFGGFLELLKNNFPIDIVLGHLFNASTASIDTDIIHLLFAVQTAVEAIIHNDAADKFLPDAEWQPLRRELGSAIDSVSKEVPLPVRTALHNRIASANTRGYNSRLHEALRSLQITLTRETTSALALRNHLFHTGYLWRRFNLLPEQDQQQIVDAQGRLRNLVNAIVLRLVHYKGAIIEATRLGTIELSKDELII